jgi:Uncharacterized low-complexity proteins
MAELMNKTAAAEHSNKNFQNVSFRNQDLSNRNFSGSDLRGADFSGSNLSGADFTNVTTGITPANKAIIFVTALVISLLSGYVAMLAGRTIQFMLKSDDPQLGLAGMITLVLYVIFMAYALFRGGGAAVRNLILPTCLVALVIGLVAYFTGAGTGMGMAYLILCNILLMVMFIVGTIASTLGGSLSNILFLIVAVSGAVFGRTLGGDLGPVIMAVASFLMSRRALSGAKGFSVLRRISSNVTRNFGTSFRKSNLAGANFSNSKLHNADFSRAELPSVNWGNSKRVNCNVSSES